MYKFEPKTCPEAYIMQEIERLNVQVAMLRSGIAWISGLVENWSDDETKHHDTIMSQSMSDWLKIHDKQVRGAALEEAANIPGIPRICRDSIRAMKWMQ